jgi:DNA-binding transcriptional LysR family regulator
MERREIESLWTHLHWLVVLGTQGSFTAAAQRLGVSKAAMSQRIAELERAAGIALVRRTTRSVQLTEAGSRLVESTRGAFEQIASEFSGVRELSGTPSGLLKVTAPVAFSRQQLVSRIPEFLGLHPGVGIELDMSDELRSLARDGFDLAIRHTATPPETHVAWRLAPTQSILVASPEYLKRAGHPGVPGELEALQCLFYQRSQSAPVWTFAPALTQGRGKSASKEKITVAVSGSFAANNSEALRDGAIAGLGIALLPDFSAQEALQDGRLVEVLPGWRPMNAFGDFVYAVRPHAAHVPRVVAAFVGYLQEQFANGFSP